MSTTVLVVEILVIGIQAGITILLLAIGLLGYGVVHKPLSLLDAHGGAWRWIPLIAILVVATCYKLGVLVDRIVMLIFFWIRKACPGFFRWLEKWVKEPCQRDEAFVRVLSDEKQLSAFLQDYRSRVRIARAVVFHLILICLVFLLTPHLMAMLPRNPKSILFVEILGAIFVLAAFFSWSILQATFEERLRQVEGIRGKR